MSVDQIGAWFGGIVAVITAISALVVTIRNGQASAKDVINRDEKLQEIHVLVNSRLSEALREIAELRHQVADYTGSPDDKAKSRKADRDLK